MSEKNAAHMDGLNIRAGKYSNQILEQAARALAKINRGQKARLLQFVANHPDKFTHTIEAETAIGYVPNRAADLNEDLVEFGLVLVSYLPEPGRRLKNRFGEVTCSHKWRLALMPTAGGV